jgi:hypothetical protein
MALFGKKTINEYDASKEFVDLMLQGSMVSWPKACEILVPLEAKFTALEEDSSAAFEFALCLISIQMRALQNLLTEDQAKRIRNHIFGILHSTPSRLVITPFTEDGERKMSIDSFGFFCEDSRDLEANTTNYPQDEILLYEELFDAAIQQGNFTTSGPAELLCMRIGVVDENNQHRPAIVQQMFNILTSVGGNWWKECISKYRIVS